MKSIFIDCNDELDAVFARVHRPDDPPIMVHTARFAPADLPRLIDGYDICLDDHSYMPTELVGAVRLAAGTSCSSAPGRRATWTCRRSTPAA